MILTEEQLKILSAAKCPYCGGKTKILSETDVYGREYKGRKIIACLNFPECNSFVGTHDDGMPLGRLANKELRDAKISAHLFFDKIWKEKLLGRSELYKRLSSYLEIPIEYTHIGMFQVSTCIKVREWSEKLYNELS